MGVWFCVSECACVCVIQVGDYVKEEARKARVSSDNVCEQALNLQWREPMNRHTWWRGRVHIVPHNKYLNKERDRARLSYIINYSSEGVSPSYRVLNMYTKLYRQSHTVSCNTHTVFPR